MARRDLHAGRNRQLSVDVRADTLQGIPVLVLIPLIRSGSAPQPARGLNPKLVVCGAEYQLATQLIASVPRKSFGPPTGTIAPYRDDTLRAPDVLFSGF